MIFLPRYRRSSSRVFTEFSVVIARGIFGVILILRGFTESELGELQSISPGQTSVCVSPAFGTLGEK
jgi:hypothetical protein